MDTYTFMRQLADSWILLAMFGFFTSAAVWAFLPSQRRARDDASMIPFRNDIAPKAGADACADQDAHQLKGQPHD